ncbi:Flp family type IVb pilin [Gilliamella sp. Pra-s65]|uniref:Flp family type IVb pilin n=1 Tax=unclassified Gilliamella TaxID=2685620 RepID=UPI00136653B3|nr:MULTISPECIES: Flp family type IVb pilin [unclassified Gilliamella]MWN89521.1 Flp family type IVb pilin [Gilliamella sp. Pra-s65]MWP72529.1 Flp family type IVb pilin [Gilliamella sp. Pra-s52]
MMYLSAVRAQTRAFLGKFVKSEKGVTAIEYAIVAAGVAAVVFVIFGNSGPVKQMLDGVFNKLSSRMSSMIS